MWVTVKYFWENIDEMQVGHLCVGPPTWLINLSTLVILHGYHYIPFQSSVVKWPWEAYAQIVTSFPCSPNEVNVVYEIQRMLLYIYGSCNTSIREICNTFRHYQHDWYWWWSVIHPDLSFCKDIISLIVCFFILWYVNDFNWLYQ